MQHLVNDYGLRITNELSEPWIDQWIFRNMMGVLRKIDFVIVSKIMSIHSVKACLDLDLGSDQRAVTVVMPLRKRYYYVVARGKDAKN